MFNRVVFLLSLAFCSIISLPDLAKGQSCAQNAVGHAEQTFCLFQTSLARAADDALSPDVSAGNAKPVEAIDDASLKPAGNVPTATRPVDPIMNLVRPILAREGVPVELSAAIAVESAGNPYALSQKGARGLWQLMPATARRYGLHVDSRIDERVDVEKSTTVAARYLRDLYIQFGSWPLAIAAYNTGEVNLQRAIKRSGSNEFAALSFLGLVPLETRNYVPAVLAAMSASSTIESLDHPVAPGKTIDFAMSRPN